MVRKKLPEQTKADRMLCPVNVANTLSLKVHVVAQAMRVAGVTEPLTVDQAKTWRTMSQEPPAWLVELFADAAVQAAVRRLREETRDFEHKHRMILLADKVEHRLLAGAENLDSPDAEFIASDMAFRRYCDDDNTIARRSGKNIILEWRSDDEEGEEDWEDGGPGSLATLVGLRSELAAGDLRPLYLAWLASIRDGADAWSNEEEDPDGEDEADDDRLEPPVPEGLNSLTGAQRALVDFLRIDQDLLAAAIAGAPSMSTAEDAGQADFLGAWLKSLTAAQKDHAIRRLLSDDDPHARAELLRAARPRPARRRNASRTVSTLLAAAAIRADTRETARQQEAERQRTMREEKVRQERERQLADLSDQGDRPWNEVNALAAAKTSKSYDAAVKLLSDLETISRRGGDQAAFARRLADLRSTHQRKPSFIDRLDAAGLP